MSIFLMINHSKILMALCQYVTYKRQGPNLQNATSSSMEHTSQHVCPTCSKKQFFLNVGTDYNNRKVQKLEIQHKKTSSDCTLLNTPSDTREQPYLQLRLIKSYKKISTLLTSKEQYLCIPVSNQELSLIKKSHKDHNSFEVAMSFDKQGNLVTNTPHHSSQNNESISNLLEKKYFLSYKIPVSKQTYKTFTRKTEQNKRILNSHALLAKAFHYLAIINVLATLGESTFKLTSISHQLYKSLGLLGNKSSTNLEQNIITLLKSIYHHFFYNGFAFLLQGLSQILIIRSQLPLEQINTSYDLHICSISILFILINICLILLY